MESFLRVLERAGFNRVTSRPIAREYLVRPCYASKGQPDQRIVGSVVEMEHTEAYFDEHGILEVIESK